MSLLLEAIKTANYNHIYNHELAHKNAGGKYAGAIHIQRNEFGIPIAGHVPIQMPTLDKNNPDNTINHANIVIDAALAPGDPSAQDYKVASQARDIKYLAQSYKANHQGKKLDINA